MKYGISTLIAVLLAIAYPSSLKAQKLALKSNLVAWATTTPNLGFEMAVDNQYTVQLFGSYNPLT